MKAFKKSFIKINMFISFILKKNPIKFNIITLLLKEIKIYE